MPAIIVVACLPVADAPIHLAHQIRLGIHVSDEGHAYEAEAPASLDMKHLKSFNAVLPVGVARSGDSTSSAGLRLHDGTADAMQPGAPRQRRGYPRPPP